MANTGSVLLSGTLLDNSGNPISGQTIALTYTPSGSTTPVSIGSVTTTSTGAFSSTVTVPAPGTYVFTATFAAVTGYDGTTASTGSTAVNVKTVLTITATVQ
jgi:hypothetical protein